VGHRVTIGGIDHFKPADIIQWAIAKDIPLPPRLQKWWKKQNKPIEQPSVGNNEYYDSLSQQDYAILFKQSAWTIADAAALFDRLYDDAEGKGWEFKHSFEISVAIKELIPLATIGEHDHFKPADIINWAIAKDIPMPPRLQEWCKKQNKPIEQPSAGNIEDNTKGNNEQVLTPSNNKSRKKLMPLQRNTTESLQLIYAITKTYNVEYEDDLTGSNAWGLIVSGKFTSNLIKTKPANNHDVLVLNDGEELTQTEFIRKYRDRFTSLSNNN
jgi:hypothetical protein